MRRTALFVALGLFWAVPEARGQPAAEACNDGRPENECTECTWSCQTIRVDPVYHIRGEPTIDINEINRFLISGFCDYDEFSAKAIVDAPHGKQYHVDSSTPRVRAKYKVSHIKPCVACTKTEGRGKASGSVGFAIDAEIGDHDDAGARAHGFQQVLERTTGLECIAEGRAEVSARGWTTYALRGEIRAGGEEQFGFTLGGGFQTGRNFGTGNRVSEVFVSDLDECRPPDVEANVYHPKIISQIREIGAEARGKARALWIGGRGGLAHAEVEIETVESWMELDLSCDNCLETASRKVYRFESGKPKSES